MRRLDPSFHQPKYQSSLGSYTVKSLGEVCERVLCGPFGSAIKETAYVEQGVPFIRITNIKAGEFDGADLVYISEADSERLSRTRLNAGDLVISQRGTVGNVCQIPGHVQVCNISANVIGIKPGANVNPRYLLHFLVSSEGQKQFHRAVSGHVQAKITTSDVQGIRIPLPPRHIQDTITDRMDAAYRRKRELEAEAQGLLESINGYVLGELGIELPEMKDESHFAQWASIVRTGRLNPEYYHAERMAAVTALLKSRYPCQPLRTVVRFRRKSVAACQGAPDTPYIGLEHIEPNTGELTADDLPHGRDFDSRATVFEASDVLFPRLRPYLNKVHLARFDGLCSTEFHILRTRENCHSAYLKEFLLTSAIVNQTKRMMTGNTLPRLQASDIEVLQIPLPPLETQHEIAAEAQARRERARALREEAQRVVTEAKAQVERMILGAT